MKKYAPSKDRATSGAKPNDTAMKGATKGGTNAGRKTSRKRTYGSGRHPAASTLTPLAIVFRYIRPTWRAYVDYVRMARREGDARAEQWMAAWDRLTKAEQRRIMPEDVCDLCQLAPSALGGIVSEQVLACGMDGSRILAGLEHPRVMAAVAKEAMKKDGYSDRALFLKATGSLPKEGASIVVHNNVAALAGRQGGPAGNGALEPMGRTPLTDTGGVGGFRSVSSSITKMDRLLQSAPAAVTADAETVDRRTPVDIGEYTEVVPDADIDRLDDGDDGGDDIEEEGE